MSTFLGFGFNMAARDVGMEAAMTSAEKHLDSLNDMIDEQNEKKPSIWQKMREGVKRFNIASMAQNMRDLTGETGRLTNSLESMGVANAQAVKPLVAQMDLTAQEARKMTSKISGMAIGMNVGATEIAEVFKAIHQAGPPAKGVIDELGLSQKDWVKITTTSGISMSELTGVMGDLTGEWQVAPKRAAGMLNSLVEIGKKTGTGIAALKTATQTVAEFGDIQAKLPAHMRISGDAITQATEQAYKLSGAYRDMGANEEQAVQLGKDTAKMFMEQSAALKLARAGLGDIGDASLYNKLRQMGVQESKVLEILAVGEQDSVKGMMMLNEEMRKAAGSSEMHKIMMGDLARTLGETGSSLVYLAESADVGSESLAKMDQMTIEGTSGLKKFGDQAFSSGRTMQEAFDLAKESFETQIRSIARANVGKLVQKQIKGYKRVGKAAKELGSDETWGPLMNAVSIFDQMGVRGLGLAFLDKNASKDAVNNAIDMGIKYEYAFDKVKQFGQEISPLMEMLGMFGPLGPLAAAGGIAALFIMEPDEAKSILGGFYDTFIGIKDMVMDVLGKIPWEKIWGGVKNAASKAWDTIVEDVPWREMLEGAMPVIREVGKAIFSALWDAFTDIIGELEGGEIAIGAALGGALLASAAFGPAGLLAGAIVTAVVAGVEASVKSTDEIASREEAEAEERRKRAEASEIKHAEKSAEVRLKIAEKAMADAQKIAQQQLGLTPEEMEWVGEAVVDPSSEWFVPEASAAYEKGVSVEGQREAAQKQADFVDWTDFALSQEAGMMMAREKVNDARHEMIRDHEKAMAETKEALGPAFYVAGLGAALASEASVAVHEGMLEGVEEGLQKAIGEGKVLEEQLDLREQFKRIQHLPDVQESMKKFAAQANGDVEVIVSGMELLVREYSKTLEDMEAQDWFASHYDEALGVIIATEQDFIDKTAEFWDTIPEDIQIVSPEQADNMQTFADSFSKLREGGMSQEDAEWEAFMPENMVTDATEFLNKMDETTGKVLGDIDTKVAETQAAAYQGGMNVLGEGGFVGGMQESMPLVDEAALNAATTAANYLASQSPIKEGPLSGEAPKLGGMFVLQQFAEGLWAEAPNLNDAMSTIMEDMVITAFSTYEQKLKEAQEKSEALKQIANAIVQQFGGKIDMGTVEVEGEVIKSGEQLLRASLSVPGLAGVTAAVISNGQETRKILAMIRKDTKVMAEAPIMQKNAKLKVDGGSITVVPG